jgi:hypothetical protein
MKLNELIDKAAEIAGSDNKLALRLGVSRQLVSNWRHGLKTCTPEDWALLAYIAGLDAEEALIRAVVAKHADTPKGERLLTALGKGLQVTGAVASLAICGSAGFLLMMSERSSTMYIKTTKGIRKRANRRQPALCKKETNHPNARLVWAF